MESVESNFNEQQARALEELKAILLEGDREKLAALEKELEKLRLDLHDKERLLSLLDPVTIEMLARAIQRSPHEMANVLAPAVGPAIRKQIASAKDDIVDALYPVIGQAIRKAVAEAMKNLARTVNEKLDKALSFRLFRKRLVARLKGVSPDEAVLSEVLPFRIHEIFYIHKKSGILLAHASLNPDDSQVKDVIGGMLTAIKSFAQDAFKTNGEIQDLNVIEYDDLQIYLENGKYAFLAVVISGVPPEQFYQQIKDLEAALHKQYAATLRDFDGNLQPYSSVPNELARFIRQFATDKANSPSAPTWAKVAVLLFFVAAFVAGIWYLTIHIGNPSQSRKVSSPKFDYSTLLTRLETYSSQGWQSDLRQIKFFADGNVLFLEGPVVSRAEGLQLAQAVAKISGFPVVVNRLSASFSKDSILAKISKTIFLFDKGSWKLNATQKARLDSLIPYLKMFSDQKISIIGHSDSLGSETINKAISLKRAQTVKDYLVSRGIAAKQLTVVGMGSTRPYLPNTTEKNRAFNRRVCLIISGQKFNEKSSAR